MEADLIIKNGFLVMPYVGVRKGDLAVREEKIVAILESASQVKAREEIDATGRYVFPGVVQPHAHLGRADQVEDFATETRSAALGGVTTTLVFHRGTEDYGSELAGMVREAANLAYADFSYHLQIMSDEQIEKMPAYLKEFGISSFKLNLGYKGEEAKDKAILEMNDGLLHAALQRIGTLPGVVACIHAENSEIIAYHTARLKKEGKDDLISWSESRPDYAEAEAVQRTLYLSELTGCPLYIAHLTTDKGLRLVREHRKKGGAAVFAETCPQYLTHHMHSPVGRRGRFIPPLRKEADNEALWQGLAKGDIDTIGIDQGVRKIEPEEVSVWERKTSPREAVTMLPVLITEGFYKRGLTLKRIAEITSANPARIFNLYPRKGTLMVGSDADVTIVDLNQVKKVGKDIIQSFSDFSIYEGWSLQGWPVLTLCRGKVIMRDGQPRGERGYGKYLERQPG